MTKVLCLDTNVLISYLVADENSPQADALVLEIVIVIFGGCNLAIAL